MVKKEKTQAGKATHKGPTEIKNDRSSHPKAGPDELLLQEIEKLKSELAAAEGKVLENQDKYLRLSAEFDNYRKRTLKEKTDLLKAAGEDTITRVLPVLDDFERALISMENSTDIEAVKSGILLIYSKLKEVLLQLGIREIESRNLEFNTDLHEAITKIPAPSDDLKGKVVDVVQKGYYLNDKILRFAKVIIGE